MAAAKKSKSKEVWCFSIDGESDMCDDRYNSLAAAEAAARKEIGYFQNVTKLEFFKVMKTVEVKQTVEFKEIK